MKVKISYKLSQTSSRNGKSSSWDLPCALLKQHSGYFRRVEKFREANEGIVNLEDQDAKYFNYFVEFLYYGHYTLSDDPVGSDGIRDDAKAWVLGDYLDAPEFKNCAMRSLYDTYFPTSGSCGVSINARTIDYCCSNSGLNSPLRKLYESAAIGYWHDQRVVALSRSNKDKWDRVWQKHPEFSATLIFYLNSSVETREGCVDDLQTLLEATSK
jgi:hypothetical protein